MADHKFRLMETPKRDVSDNLLRGTINLSVSDLAKFAPQYSGYTQIFVMKMPAFMQSYDESLEHPLFPKARRSQLKDLAAKHAQNLKNLIEFCSIAYSGTPDLSLQMAQVETGYAGVEVAVPTSASFDNTDFTIRILEQRGATLRKAIEFYTMGLSDPYGNVSHLYGSNHPYAPPSYAMEIAIVQFDPRMMEVQDVSYWQNVTIKPVGRDELDWQQGQVTIVEPKDVQFTGRYIADANTLLESEAFQNMVRARLKLVKVTGEFNLNL